MSNKNEVLADKRIIYNYENDTFKCSNDDKFFIDALKVKLFKGYLYGLLIKKTQNMRKLMGLMAKNGIIKNGYEDKHNTLIRNMEPEMKIIFIKMIEEPFEYSYLDAQDHLDEIEELDKDANFKYNQFMFANKNDL